MDPAQLQQTLGSFKHHIEALYASALRSRKRVAELEARIAMHREGAEAPPDAVMQSQYGEDVLLWEVLGRPRRGFFIEVGAFDGRSLSVSWFFERIGWTGLLIEGIPERCAQCRAARPKSRVEHAALSRRGASGVTRFSVPTGQPMLSFHGTHESHRQRVAREGGAVVEVEVPVTSMDALLEKAPPERIDFAVIDVEGGEPDVLDGFDLAGWKPRVLVIEDNLIALPETPVTRVMAGRGYVEATRLVVNRVYVHQDEREVLERARGWML